MTNMEVVMQMQAEEQVEEGFSQHDQLVQVEHFVANWQVLHHLDQLITPNVLSEHDIPIHEIKDYEVTR